MCKRFSIFFSLLVHLLLLPLASSPALDVRHTLFLPSFLASKYPFFRSPYHLSLSPSIAPLPPFEMRVTRLTATKVGVSPEGRSRNGRQLAKMQKKSGRRRWLGGGGHLVVAFGWTWVSPPGISSENTLPTHYRSLRRSCAKMLSNIVCQSRIRANTAPQF